MTNFPTNIFSLAIVFRVSLYTFSIGLLSGAEYSKLVYPGNDGRLIYTAHPNTEETERENVIPDFSTCGYKGGGVAIPFVPVKEIVHAQGENDAARIQAAIDRVCALPLNESGFRGAVLLKAGIYDIDDFVDENTRVLLRINKSGVVLRGEGQGKGGTVLVSKKSERFVGLSVAPDHEAKFKEKDPTAIIDDYVGTGATKFSVEDASNYAIGDTIRIYFTPNDLWISDIYANAYMEEGDTDWTPEDYTIPFKRSIVAISNNKITINSPIVLPMQEKYGSGRIAKIELTSGEVLNNVGIENLMLSGVGITEESDAESKDRICDGITMDSVENCWVREFSIMNQFDACVQLNESRYVTVEDCYSIRPLGPKSGGYRYTFRIGSNSSHILVQRCFAYDGRHDFVTGSRTPGPIVFLDCLAIESGTNGPHHRWSSGSLYDSIKTDSIMAASEHRGTSGTGHSWTGHAQVVWNCDVSKIVCDAPRGFQNYAIGNVGELAQSRYISNNRPGVFEGYIESHGQHVEPRSLYLKQLEDRLGKEAVDNVTNSLQRRGFIWYEILERVKYFMPSKYTSFE